MKFQTKVQYEEYRSNKHLRMETETVARMKPDKIVDAVGGNIQTS